MGETLRQLWDAHRDQAFERVANLEEAAAALAAGEIDGERLASARADAHKLHGSVGMYGFQRAGRVAGELEDILSAGGGDIAQRTPEVAGLVISLRSELEGEPVIGAEPADESATTLLIVGDDTGARDALAAAAPVHGFQVVSCPVQEGEAHAAEHDPDLILFDVGSGAAPPGAAALEALGRIPGDVLALAEPGDLSARVELVRRGVRGFLDRRQEPGALLEMATRFAGGAKSRFTVLAVDDDASVTAAVGAMLGGRGYAVEAVADPELFWDRLAEVSPDLAIIDLDMPQVSGIELCSALRADPRWAALPVLILTAYRHPELMRGAFAAGADDFLSKPILEEELVGRVANRLGRARAFDDGARRDALTGTATRPVVQDELARVADLARAGNDHLCVGVFGVDGLGRLNGERGLADGDAVLRRCGRVLGELFAREPLCRWDGDKFLVGLVGLEPGAGSERMGEALQRLNADGLDLTTSAGIAAAAGDAIDLGVLVGAAEGALQTAKARGGAQLVASGEAAASGQRVDVVMVEDDPSVADVLDVAISTLGLSSRRFDDGAAAAALLGGESPEVRGRLILLDWDLPGLDGLNVLRELAASGVLEESRVIMLTARSGEQETLKALELGAIDYIAKPFSVPVLTERVRRALDR